MPHGGNAFPILLHHGLRALALSAKKAPASRTLETGAFTLY